MSCFLETLAELHFIVMLLLLVFAVVFLRNPITNMYILLAEWIFNTAPPQISQKYNNIKFSPLTKLNLTTTPELSTKKPRKKEKCSKFETPPRAKQKKEINASDFNGDLAYLNIRSSFIRGSQILIYPVVPITGCYETGDMMRYEQNRFASFSGISDRDLPPGGTVAWPLRLASVGYYFDHTRRRPVCFSCGESYPHHAPDACGWREENIRYGHGFPTPPHDPNAPCDPTTFNVVSRSASSTRGDFVTHGYAPILHNPPLGGASQQLPRAPLTRSDAQNDEAFANHGAPPSVGGGFNTYLPAGGASQQLPRAPDTQNEGAFANHGAPPSGRGVLNHPAGGASQQLPRAPLTRSDAQDDEAFANHGATPSGTGGFNHPANGASQPLPRAPVTRSATQDDMPSNQDTNTRSMRDPEVHGATPSGTGGFNLPVSGSPQPLPRAPVTRSATQDDMPSNHGTNTRSMIPVRQYEGAGVVIAMPGAMGDRERTQGPVESGSADHAIEDMGAEMVCVICKCQPATGITQGGQAVCYDCVQFSLP